MWKTIIKKTTTKTTESHIRLINQPNVYGLVAKVKFMQRTFHFAHFKGLKSTERLQKKKAHPECPHFASILNSKLRKREILVTHPNTNYVLIGSNRTHIATG